MKKTRTIILIGGAPTTGKSEMARRLSKHLDLPWISTDQLRGIMKSGARAEDLPRLFDTEGIPAEEFLQKYTAEEIADAQYKQGDEVWVSVKALV